MLDLEAVGAKFRLCGAPARITPLDRSGEKAPQEASQLSRRTRHERQKRLSGMLSPNEPFLTLLLSSLPFVRLARSEEPPGEAAFGQGRSGPYPGPMRGVFAACVQRSASNRSIASEDTAVPAPDVALIACSKSKAKGPAPARELYDSPLFRKSYRYVRSRSPEQIYVLSAKHGLVPDDEVISPYDRTLNDMSAEEVREWAESVLDSLRSNHDLTDTRFLILAGKRYRKHLLPEFGSYEVPMEGLGIGEQLHFLKTRLNR